MAAQARQRLVMAYDRGSQYASESHRALLARHGVSQSMSRKGNSAGIMRFRKASSIP
ncbi:transposase family protein [Methylobacter sp. BBA5.1]|uniref:integrase catalytic domain-containing protein n=1 Tax=Methylobacter sp. BBA5.1 TaxID=1495064 RepID=UPI00350F428F